MPTDVVSVERVIPAPAEQIYAILADPARHREIDGSGTVREASTEHTELKLGDEFGMGMHWYVPYATRNRVVELEPGRRIAWRTEAAYPVVKSFVTGRTWRYELEPVDGGTLVRESWDISTEKLLSRPFVRRLAGQTRENMARTLERIEQVLTA